MVKCEIVSEIGVNWHGYLDTAKKMILESKKAGATFAKFQMFNYENIKDCQEELKERLAPMILNETTVRELIEYGKQVKIQVFFSVMYPKAVDILEKVGVTMYKIRAKDSTNLELINKVKATGKPIIVSINESKPLDIKGCKQLYCISQYPVDILNLDMDAFLNIFKDGKFDGFSSHFEGIAAELGVYASTPRKDFIIEKHVKLTERDIDANVSVTFEELAELAKHLRKIEKMKGD